MKGLLLKDFYMAKRYCRSYVLVIAGFMALSFASTENLFYVFYPCLLSGMLPATLLSYDERSGWNTYCLTLPYAKAQIVSGKYLIGLLTQMLVLLLTGSAQAVRTNMNGSFAWIDFGMLMSMLLVISCVASSISLPFMFKLGVEKGRTAYFAMIGVVCAATVVASSVLSEDALTGVSLNGILPTVCLIAIAVYALSWRLSIVFYEKREI